MSADQLKSFALRYTAAWCSKKPENVAAFYGPNASLTINGGEPAVGRDAIAQVARGFMTEFPDMQVLMDGLESEGGRTLYRWTVVGTYVATGKRVRFSGHEDWRMGEDGLIAESLGSFDAEEYDRQIQHGFDS